MKTTNYIKTFLRKDLQNKGVNHQFEVGEVALIYKKKHNTPDINNKLTCSNDVYYTAKQSYQEGEIEMKEHFKIILLSRSNTVLAVATISEGGLSGTVADPKNIFQTALLGNAASIILFHNHPSGSLKPSRADIELTERLVKVGEFHDLPILDHIILTTDSYYSFKDEGII